ncbi:hypothetical protein Q1695_002662 [Nippostrongylus brasiliensis]|nr:hypothetical protein Q1695_002662 [Nippostrongylus brasiliensis]
MGQVVEDQVGRTRNAILWYDRWTRPVTEWIPRDVGRTPGRPPLRWSDFLFKSLNDRFDALRVPRASGTHWSTMERYRDEWALCWCPLEQIDDQSEDM